jgi:Phage integrase family
MGARSRAAPARPDLGGLRQRAPRVDGGLEGANFRRHNARPPHDQASATHSMPPMHRARGQQWIRRGRGRISERPKSGRAREIPISDALLPWLHLRRRSAYVVPDLPRKGKGGRYASWPSLAFDRAVEGAKLDGTPHTLRHTFAAHFLASVPDLTLLAEILGHSDTAVTKLYKHLLPDHLARARNAVQVCAPSAAADALALVRWRLERKPSGKPSGGRSPGRAAEAKIHSDFSGAGYRDRTGDIKLGKLALYQLS